MTLASKCERLPDLRLIGDVIQPHRFALGHVPLIGHPADHLAPEAIVILVLDPLAPAPGAVGPHEQHLAGAEGARRPAAAAGRTRWRRPCGRTARRCRPWLAAPARTTESRADPSQTSTLSSCVSASLVSRLRRPSSVSSKWLGVREPQPPGCAGSSTTGHRSPSSVSSSENSPSLPAGHEDQAARLVLDQPLQQPALLGGQLAVVRRPRRRGTRRRTSTARRAATGNCLM